MHKANWESLEKHKERPLGNRRKVEIFSGWVQNNFVKKVVSGSGKRPSSWLQMSVSSQKRGKTVRPPLLSELRKIVKAS